MSLIELLYDKIRARFEENPYRLFTEHDIHTELALLATDFLEGKGELFARTNDDFVVNRIHHEYPTPFRCDMRNFDFAMISEEEFRRRRQEKPNYRARRGYIDFVILNSRYVSSNKLSVIPAKRYKDRDFQTTLNEREHPVLDVSIEVVYFRPFDAKPHKGIMNRRFLSTVQDYKKLVAIMEVATPNGVPFCGEAAMMFFSNARHKQTRARLEEKFNSFPWDEKLVKFYPILV